MIGDASVAAVVLAGGRGRRMGGSDKGLVDFGGTPLIAAVIARLEAQVDELVINANRNLERYAQFGHRVVPDLRKDFPGPLAGLEAGVAATSSPLVLSVPCDAPFLPADLVLRLTGPIVADAADATVASAGGRRQPVFCAFRRSCAGSLAHFLDGGGRKVDDWLAGLPRVAEVTFDQAECFANVNDTAELAAALAVRRR